MENQSIALLNAIRSDASSMYQDYVPEATQDNIAEVGAAITEYQSTFNEFNQLLNKIALTFTEKRMFENPLARFKMGKLEHASEVEEYFITKIKSQVQSKNGDKTLVPKKLRTSTTYYKENRQETYQATRSFKQARQAFRTAEGVMQYLDGITSELVNSSNIDEFYIMLELLSRAGATAGVVDVITGRIQESINMEDNKAGIEQLLQRIKKHSLQMTFPSSTYHNATIDDGAGVQVHDNDIITHTPLENQVLFIDASVYTIMDVSTLSSAFNLDKLATPNIIPVPNGSLGDSETDPQDTIIAILVDDRLLKIWDTFNTTLTQDNAEGAFTNYFMHIDQILAISPYAQIVAFTH